MKKSKIFIAILMICLLMIAAFPMQALAAGKIAVDKPVRLTIDYTDGGAGIPNARFDLFKVADVNEYADMTVSSKFEKYKDKIEGLSTLDKMTKDGWSALASTLSQYVVSDGIANDKKGTTDFSGKLVLSDLTPGLYLVFGYGVSTYDYYVYSAIPTLIFVPALDEVENEWVYDVTVSPKFDKIYDPPEIGGRTAELGVIKVWDDSGYESKRPSSITVRLVRGSGEVYDTQLLNAANGWSYEWRFLEARESWYIVEEDAPGYAVTVVRDGKTYIITNKYSKTPGSPESPADPPVYKRITGDEPAEEETFTFVLKADKKSFPMPAGSKDGVKTVTIKGAGSTEFGEIVFRDPGVYTYTVSERNDRIMGYAYDKTVYSIRYDVTKRDVTVVKDGKTVTGEELVIDATYMNEDGDTVKRIEFTNKYRMPGNRLPQTGSLWWPVPVLIVAGLALVTAGVVLRRRNED